MDLPLAGASWAVGGFPTKKYKIYANTLYKLLERRKKRFSPSLLAFALYSSCAPQAA